MRIIAGSAKGHTIQAPKGLDTRPTLDRVRESVFNVLAHRGLYGKRVLDLFSGTGAVAIEALSRGAAEALCVDVRTEKCIRANAIHCQVDDRLQVLPCKLASLGPRLKGQRFDLIFSDPPYQKGYIEATIQLVVDHDLLAKDGFLLLEHHKDEAIHLPDGWEVIKEQKFGYTMVTYCQQIA